MASLDNMKEVSRLLRATSSWWRPIIGWACTANAWIVLVILPINGVHIAAEELYAMLTFDALVVGIRGFEKLRANANYGDMNIKESYYYDNPNNPG